MTEQDKMREALRWSYEPPCAAQNDKAALVAMRGNKIELMLTGKKATVVNDLLQAALSTQQDALERVKVLEGTLREYESYLNFKVQIAESMGENMLTEGAMHALQSNRAALERVRAALSTTKEA